ncbi:hypothetical protein B0H17DRAFT_1187476, partial [Mycena rosella]
MPNFFLPGLIFRPSAAAGALRPAVHSPGSILALIITILGGTPPDSAPHAQKKISHSARFTLYPTDPPTFGANLLYSPTELGVLLGGRFTLSATDL